MATAKRVTRTRNSGGSQQQQPPTPTPTPQPKAPPRQQRAPVNSVVRTHTGGPLINLAMIAILQGVGVIRKERENTQQKFLFRGIDDIMNALHPLFAAHGVLSVPFYYEMKPTSVITTINQRGNVACRVFVDAGYIFTAADGSTITARATGEALDYADKATAKACSMAFKTVLCQIFQIPTDEVDSDAVTPTIDAAASLAAPGAQYEGQALAALEAERDRLIHGNERIPSELLGKIAELRAEADEASRAATTVSQTTKGETVHNSDQGAGDDDRLPGGDPEHQQPQQPAKRESTSSNSWEDHEIVYVPGYKGKRLGDLNTKALGLIVKSWCEKHHEKIKADPDRLKESQRIQAAFTAKSESK